MQDCAVFRHIDARPAKHCVNLGRKFGFLGQLLKQAQRFISDAILRIIEEYVIERQRKSLKSLRIRLKQISHVDAGHFLPMFFQRSPSRELGRLCHRKVTEFFCDATKGERA